MLWREDAPKIKSSIKDSEEYVRLVEPLKTVDLLYIDDLFKTGRSDTGEPQRPTVADINLAFEIINHRYTAGLTTIISSECTDAELIDIDQAVAGRIIERSRKHCISLKGKEKDYRLKGNVTL
jgi:DNA replication protein DnaC